jgi:hypothetical protein
MKDNDSLFLENLYGKVVINEISSKYVDEVKDAIADNELPFNNIFGDKLRIVIPVKGTQVYNEILDAVSKIKNYSGFDPQKKEVIKTIKLDPKYGGGEKEQRINLGKAISSLSIPEDQKKKFLNWFAGYNSNIPEMENLKKYSIVISRSPIDVLRMSDIGKISSCHSQGGQYFSCAIQEAKKGGPIAYLVKTEDIKELSEDEFQNEEIFEDSSRDVSGITALARLRVRKYVNKNTEEEIAVPETRIYGNRVSGFYDTIKDFFRDKQPDLNAENISKQFKNKELLRTGGTYTDSGDDSLFNKMFDIEDTLYGSLSHRGEDEEEENGDEARANQFDEELREFDRRYGNFTHFSTGYSVEIGDEAGYVYYNAWGGVKFDMDENIEFTDDFYDIDLDDHYSINSIQRYDPNGQYEWQKRLPYGLKNDESFALKLQKFFKNFYAYDSTRLSENLSRFQVDRDGDIFIEVGFGDDNTGSSFNTDDYRYYLQDIEKFDDNYDEIQKALIKALYSAGFIKASEGNENVVENIFETEEELGQALKKFEYDNSTDTFDLHDVQLLILDDTAFGTFDREKNINLEKDFSGFLEKFLQNYFKPEQKENKDQMTFKGFLESYQTPILKKYGISFTLTTGRRAGFSPKYKDKETGVLTGNLSFKISYLNDTTAQLIQFLDNNYEDLVNVMKLLAFRLFNLSSDYSENLQRVYGKFLA